MLDLLTLVPGDTVDVENKENGMKSRKSTRAGQEK